MVNTGDAGFLTHRMPHELGMSKECAFEYKHVSNPTSGDKEPQGLLPVLQKVLQKHPVKHQCENG